MIKAAVYVRYSSSNQSDASLSDQERLCRQRAKAEGFAVVDVYSDAAISGSRNDRPGYQAMLGAALAGQFSAIVVDDLSRLTRDNAEFYHVTRTLAAAEVRLIAVADGFDSEQDSSTVIGGVKGLINSIFLQDLAKKTHRGLEGKALMGAAAGGGKYGYETVADGDNSFYRIKPSEAAVVLRIFTEYDQGKSVRQIVSDFNTEGILSPRGSTWGVSAVVGSRDKGTGLLRNPLYKGLLVWNKSKWIKDPLNPNRRIRKERPPEQWIEHQDDSLIIIEPKLWQRVQDRLERNYQVRAKYTVKGRGRYWVSGLLACGLCGGGMTLVNSDRYGCSNHKVGNTCTMKTTIKRDRIESIILTELRSALSSDRYRAEYIKAFREALATDSASHQLKQLNSDLASVNRMIGNAVDALVSLGGSAALTDKIASLESRKSQIEQAMAEVETEPMPEMSDAEIGKGFDAAIESIASVEGADVDQLEEILGALLDGPVKVYPSESKKPAIELTIAGLPLRRIINSKSRKDGSGSRI